MNRAQRRAAARAGAKYRVKYGAHKGEILTGEQAVMVGQLINNTYNDTELKIMTADQITQVTDWAVDAVLEAGDANPGAEIMDLLAETEDLYHQKLAAAGKTTFDDQEAADMFVQAGEEAFDAQAGEETGQEG